MVENSRNDEVDKGIDIVRSTVKTWRGGKNHRPCPRESEHVFEMDFGERGFPRNQNQLSPFLEADIGGPFDQVGRDSPGHPTDRSHRAGTDHHPLRLIGTARDRYLQIFVVVVFDIGQGFPKKSPDYRISILKVEFDAHLMVGDFRPRFAHYKVDGGSGGGEDFEESSSVGGSASSGNGHRVSFFAHGSSGSK